MNIKRWIVKTAAKILQAHLICPFCLTPMLNISRFADGAMDVFACVNPRCPERHKDGRGVTYRRVDVETAVSRSVGGYQERMAAENNRLLADLSAEANKATRWVSQHRPHWLNGVNHPISLLVATMSYLLESGQVPEQRPNITLVGPYDSNQGLATAVNQDAPNNATEASGGVHNG